jgi:hypothetical protein
MTGVVPQAADVKTATMIRQSRTATIASRTKSSCWSPCRRGESVVP